MKLPNTASAVSSTDQPEASFIVKLYSFACNFFISFPYDAINTEPLNGPIANEITGAPKLPIP